MSIASELERIMAAKNALKTAINLRGGTLTDEKIDHYADAVTALPTGGSVDGEIDLSFITAGAEDIRHGKVGSSIYGTPVAGTLQVSAGSSMDFYKCASVDTTAKTWTGYKAVFDAESEIWSFATDVTEGLTYGENVTPRVGTIYNSTATITAVLYQGYPENALLINCDTLNDDRFTATNCTLSTDIKKYGTGSIYIGTSGSIRFTTDIDVASSPWTAAHFFYKENYTHSTSQPLINNDDDASGAVGISIQADGRVCLYIRGGAEDFTNTAPSSGWHHIRITHTGDGTVYAYLDGEKVLTVSGFYNNYKTFAIGEFEYGDSRHFEGCIDGIEFIPLDESTIAGYSGDTAPVPNKEFNV